MKVKKISNKTWSVNFVLIKYALVTKEQKIHKRISRNESEAKLNKNNKTKGKTDDNYV